MHSVFSEDVEQLELSCIAGENCFLKLAISFKAKHLPTLWPSNPHL